MQDMMRRPAGVAPISRLAPPAPRRTKRAARFFSGPGVLSRLGVKALTGRLLVAGMLVGLVAGCARPTGDFGRASSDRIHDEILPEYGHRLKNMRGEPTSTFNLTDLEQELRDRAWTLIRPISAKDWIDGTAIEAQRTGIIKPIDDKLDPSVYYLYLRSDKFRSSETRYERVVSDISGDTDLIRPFCTLATEIEDTDTERLNAMNRRKDLKPTEYEASVGRVNENRNIIAWVKRSMSFRLAAYRYAIDRLEIETPSRQRVWDANTAWRRLAGEVAFADAGCRETKTYDVDGKARKSRIYTNWGGERPAPVK